MSTFHAITSLLDSHQVNYRTILDHPPTYTSAKSAAARSTTMDVGGKALVVKIDQDFKLFVLSAPLRFDAKAARKHFEAKKSCFATADELKQITGLVPGCVPPFGHPILPLPLYLDPTITHQDHIGFNAGSLTNSIVMRMSDYLAIAKPKVFVFGKKKL